MDRLIVSPAEAAASPAEHDPYARARHARYFEKDSLSHVVSRTRGNLFLLRPDLKGLLRSIVTGILAQAKENWPDISNFATVVLSNHLHMLLAAMGADPRCIADYIAFFKRELARRWGSEVGWSGSMWDGYKSSAIITPAAQVRALSYVVAQGTKENLVADPRDWPGFHCAESLVSGKPIEGFWFDGTGYGKARHAESAKKNPCEVERAQYVRPRAFAFDKLPALAHLSDEAYRGKMLEIVEEAVADRQQRFVAPPLGAETVCGMAPTTSRPVPTPPWFEDRRRMIVWDNPRVAAVADYLERYWTHQVEFRAAAQAWRAEEVGATKLFPDNCFVPGLRPRPIAHMEQSTG